MDVPSPGGRSPWTAASSSWHLPVEIFEPYSVYWLNPARRNVARSGASGAEPDRAPRRAPGLSRRTSPGASDQRDATRCDGWRRRRELAGAYASGPARGVSVVAFGRFAATTAVARRSEPKRPRHGAARICSSGRGAVNRCMRANELAALLSSPAAAGDMYRAIHRGIRTAGVVGADHAVAAVALAATSHLRGRPQRIALVGPSGSAKSFLMTSVLDLLTQHGVATLRTAISENTASGWSGITWGGDLLPRLWREAGGDPARVDTAVVFADELCKVALPGPDVSAATRDHRLAVQADLLQVFDPGGVGLSYRPEGDRGPSLTWRSDRSTVFVAGAFAHLPDPPPRFGPADLIRGGLIPELVGRLGRIVTMPKIGGAALLGALSHGVADLVASMAEWGFELEVPPTTLTYVARAAAADPTGTGVRLPKMWLAAATQEALVRMLEGAAPVGSRCVLSPDDVESVRATGRGTRGEP